MMRPGPDTCKLILVKRARDNLRPHALLPIPADAREALHEAMLVFGTYGAYARFSMQPDVSPASRFG